MYAAIELELGIRTDFTNLFTYPDDPDFYDYVNK